MIYFTLLRKTFGQFSQKQTLKLLLKTILITFIFLFLINLGLYYFLDWLGLYDYLIQKLYVPIFLSKIITFLTLHLVAMFLFPPLLIGVSGLFLEEIADLVEAKYYPHLPKAKKIPLMQQIKSLLILILLILLVNLLVLVFYFIPVLNLMVFYLLNGYLIGKEYFELISLRRMSREAYQTLWKRKFWGIYGGGILCSFGMTIPIVNMLVPYFATAFMVHLFDHYAD